MLLPNAQDASAKTYNYSQCAPQFCCGGPYPPFPCAPFSCLPSCSPQLDCGACPSHIIFIHKPPHTPTAVPDTSTSLRISRPYVKKVSPAPYTYTFLHSQKTTQITSKTRKNRSRTTILPLLPSHLDYLAPSL